MFYNIFFWGFFIAGYKAFGFSAPLKNCAKRLRAFGTLLLPFANPHSQLLCLLHRHRCFSIVVAPRATLGFGIGRALASLSTQRKKALPLPRVYGLIPSFVPHSRSQPSSRMALLATVAFTSLARTSLVHPKLPAMNLDMHQ